MGRFNVKKLGRLEIRYKKHYGRFKETRMVRFESSF